MTLKQTPPPAIKGLGGNGHNGENGHSGGRGAGGAAPGEPGQPARRNSVFPFLLDLGVVLALFGLIIIRPIYSELAGNVVLGAGIVLALTALVGWVREARAEYARTPD